MTIIIPSPQLLIHSKNKDYVTQISHREHKSRNLNSNLNSILDDCTINLSLMCFNGVNPAIHQARVYSSVIISDFIELNNPKNPLFYGSLAASVNDFENAIYWYKVAAKRRSITAMNAIGHIYLKMYQKTKADCTNKSYLIEEDDEEEEEIYDNKEFLGNNYSKNLFYKCNPLKEALKWFYRAYKFGSVQSIQYIATVYEAIGAKSESLHFYRKHYEKTNQYYNLISKSKDNLLFGFSSSTCNFYSLYSKYKIGLLLNFFSYNNSAFIWFISCAEDFGHIKSIKRMLNAIKNENNSVNKSYGEIYSAFLQKLKCKFNYFENTKEIHNSTIERNIRLAKIISILKFKSIINSSITNHDIFKNNMNSNNDNNNDTSNNNTNIYNANTLSTSASNKDNDTNNNFTSNNNGNISNNSKSDTENDNSIDKKQFNSNNQNDDLNICDSSFESSICADSALDIDGWWTLNTLFSTEFLSGSSYSQKQQYSTKPLELPSFKIASHAFWRTDPLTTSARSILHYESSLQSGCDSFFPSTNLRMVLQNKDNASTVRTSKVTASISAGKSELFHSPVNTSVSQFSSHFRGKKLGTFPSICPAFFASGSKSQYLHLALKFASPIFSQRNLHLSFLFLQKLWLLHPKGISESLIFRNKCKSRNAKDLIQCGFIAILCHDSKFALDLFIKAAKNGNETGSLMAGLLMFHGLNVLRQVKNGCYYLSQCSTDPIALLHLSLACNDEIYEMRAKEALGMYSSSFQYDPSNLSNSINLLNYLNTKNSMNTLNSSNLYNSSSELNPKQSDGSFNMINKGDESNISSANSRCRMYEWVGDLFSNSVKLPLNVGIALMFYGIALKKAEEDGDDINGIIKKISYVSREPVFSE